VKSFVQSANFESDIRHLSAISPMSGSAARFLFKHQVLRKRTAEYFYDDQVGYIFAREPNWLDEAYSEPISSLDTGVLARNLGNIDTVSHCLATNHQGRFINGVDIGAGYGVFVRGMRDRGFDFYWSDKYSENLLARGFEANYGQYSVAVAFEVLEHLPNPIEFLRESRKKFGFHTCFFSATCFDETNLPDTDWWYWAFEGGQHISFFTKRALLWMAEQMDMSLRYIERDVFAFSNLEWRADRDRAKLWRRAYRRVGRTLFPHQVESRESLTWSDHLKLRDKLHSGDTI
jgi:hypothetical protein